ncbi:aminomethyltransferase [Chitinasiproducens palmae]|uniref:aminomethyltransferase n=2 Tax=Chitinasiproducens palmae TaxID=1770053 RepID=A0A1H2PPG1_9BURK|nr:aminomethyltransferase [Chitinasiproducens palmae]
MVDFGGWHMPVNYGSQIDEHHAVRTAAGMFDVSHMRVVDVEGDAARTFLQKVLANDVAKLTTPGRALYSCMLNPSGGVIDDLIVYHFDARHYRLIVNAATAEQDIAWLGSAAAQGEFGVIITPRRDLAIIAVQGPQARARVWQAVAETRPATESLKPFSAADVETTGFGQLMVGRTGYTGEDGFEIVVPADHAPALWQALAAADVRPCGLGARDTLRLEAGMNLYGQDMDATTSPLDAGLAWTVDTRAERPFIGRDALASEAPRAFLGLILQGGGILRAHQQIHTRLGAGEVTSGTFSPTMQRSIGLARLPAGIAPGETVEVAVRDKRLAAEVVKLPFVRHGKILVEQPAAAGSAGTA